VNKNNRVFLLDILRIIACYLIILRHVVDSYALAESNFKTTALLHSISYIAMPLFFLITGYFLLEYKEESIKDFYGKRLKRIVIPYIFWGIIYIIYLNNLTTANLGYDIITLFLYNKIYIHFWYVYYIVGVYLAIPFLRKVMKNLSSRDLCYIIGIWFFISILNPILNNFKYGISVSFIFSEWWGYIIIGYTIRRVKLTKDKYIKSWIILMLSYLLVLIVNMSKTLSSNLAKIPTLGELTIPMVLISVSIFYIIIYLNNHMKINISNKTEKFIYKFSNLTYSMYLIHNLVIHNFLAKRFGVSLDPYFINPILGAPIQALVIFLICSIITVILSKIPILKNISV
jgi:surface polysaccharide O-acyltransferase-like enzyme